MRLAFRQIGTREGSAAVLAAIDSEFDEWVREEMVLKERDRQAPKELPASELT
jgi:hypothetical protein